METKGEVSVYESHDAMPGEVVLRHRHDGPTGYSEWGFEFTVRRQENGSFEAATPYRSCVYSGRTLAESVGALMHGMVMQGRDGSIDPSIPWAAGRPPIQHALSVLSDRLNWQIARRADHIHEAEHPANVPGPEVRGLAVVARDNEVISALATSVAALARVRDL